MLRTLMTYCLTGALALLAGCAGGGGSTREGTGDSSGASVSDYLHSKAMQSFINGSLFEMKGDNAQAILEYQDALGYEKNSGIYYALARSYSRLGKHSLAVEAAREAVRLDPNNLDYRGTLAAAYLSAYETDTAAQEYEEIVKRDSSKLDAWYNLARLYEPRKPLRALELYEQITTRFGPEWEVMLRTAELANKLRQFGKAADALSQMTEIDPGNQALLRTLAQTYARAEKYDRALAVLQELRESNPADLDVLAEEAEIHLLRKEYRQASELFETILKQDTVSMEAKLHVGELYFAQMDKDSTLAPVTRSIFERIRDKYPQDWHAYWFLGAIGTVTHDDSLTVRNFRKVTELASWNADAWVYLSSVFLDKNNFAEVSRVLESAVKVVPEDFRVNFLLGVAYNRLERNEDAARVLERARQLNGKDVDAITQLAIVYEALKRYDETDSLYEEALRFDPANHLVLNNYSYSLAERNIQLERAREMAEKAVKARPDNASYLDTMGWVYYRLGEYREAAEYVRKAIEKGDASAVVYEHLGDILYKLDDKQGALEQWNIALQLDGNNRAL
ncbi:tetratricopeptide repeat protein, partial [bacterium]